MKETLASMQENQSNKQNKKNSEEYSGKQEDDETMNVVVNKIHNSNKIEIILKHNNISLIQLCANINKNDNECEVSIYNNQPNKQKYESNGTCDIRETMIQGIISNNADEIKKFIEYILIDVLKLNFSYQTSVIERKHNIKIAECFDINSNNYKNRDKIAKKIADAEIVIQEVQPSAQQPNIQERSGNIIQNISQWCLNHCCSCCLGKT